MEGNMRFVPWILCILVGVWFGTLAQRTARNWVLWMLGGALFALVVSTIVVGLNHATFLPISHEMYVAYCIRTILEATALVLALGWLFTAGLHGQAAPLVAKVKGLFGK